MAEETGSITGEKVTLPAPGEDVMASSQLWPTPKEGLFGLETTILHARMNTMCAMLQELRVEVAAIRSEPKGKVETQPDKKRRRGTTSGKMPAEKAPSQTSDLNTSCLEDLYKLLSEHGLDKDACAQLLEDSISWEESDSSNKLYSYAGRGRDVKGFARKWVNDLTTRWPLLSQIYTFKATSAHNLFFHVARAVDEHRKSSTAGESFDVMDAEENLDGDTLIDPALQ